MSENVTNTVPQPETVAPEAAVQENAQQPQGGKPAKKKLSDLFHNHSNVKTVRVLKVILGILLILLGAAQLTITGIRIYNGIEDYIDTVVSLDYEGIVALAMGAIFVIVLLVAWINTIVSLICKGHLVRFDIATTLMAQSVFWTFAEGWLPPQELLLLHIPGTLWYIMLALVAVFTFVRLFSLDFSTRIAPVICSAIGVVVALLLFFYGAGNFITMELGTASNVELADLNLIDYIRSSAGLISNGRLPDCLESDYLLLGANYLENQDTATVVAIFGLQLLSLAGATLLPCAALSLLGYLIHGLTAPNYLQYHNLYACQKVTISMLIVGVLSLGASVLQMLLVAEFGWRYISIELNYFNIGLTFALYVAMIVLTAVPWNIHRSVYRRRLAAFNERERRS